MQLRVEGGHFYTEGAGWTGNARMAVWKASGSASVVGGVAKGSDIDAAGGGVLGWRLGGSGARG